MPTCIVIIDVGPFPLASPSLLSLVGSPPPTFREGADCGSDTENDDDGSTPPIIWGGFRSAVGDKSFEICDKM